MPERNYYTDLIDNAEKSSNVLSELPAGSKERLTEAQIYDMYNKALITMEQMANQNEIDKEKLKIEADEAKWKKIMDIVKTGTSVLQIGVYSWFGWNYLKFNAGFGNMVGKDGKGWFDEIKKIKPGM